jgi:exodeoxyribonuclease-3
MEEGQAEAAPGYGFRYFNSAVKKGYSGTAVFSKTRPLKTTSGIGVAAHDSEGRVITAEYDAFYLVNVYVPNSQRGLARLPYRMQWEDDFLRYITGLDKVKPVVVCGDLNVAHEEIDIKNAAANRKNAGFTAEERDKMTALLKAGFVDSFRALYPDTVKYSWWSYWADARERNIGWRLDYFLLSGRLMPRVGAAEIYNEVFGSDHCPVGLVLDI